MTVGELIRNARIKQSVSQLELATRLGVTPQSINQYENNRRKPKIDTLRKICQALGLTISDLGSDIWKLYSAEDLKEDLALSGHKIKITISSKMPENREEEKRSDVLLIFNDLSSHGKEQAPKLLSSFSHLNSIGQSEAVKRINELTKIPEYQKEKN